MDKATIEIDCDAGTVSVWDDSLDSMDIKKQRAFVTTKSRLVATILAMQSRELMAMDKQELMARHLVMMERQD